MTVIRDFDRYLLCNDRGAAFHWFGLPKDGRGNFQHHAYADLSIQWQIFFSLLGLLAPGKRPDPQTDQGDGRGAGCRHRARSKASPSRSQTRCRAAKRSRGADGSQPPPMLTLGQLLRQYGHVPQYVER
jgi:hypothetical protein